jgi:hypothetical protein
MAPWPSTIVPLTTLSGGQALEAGSAWLADFIRKQRTALFTCGRYPPQAA